MMACALITGARGPGGGGRIGAMSGRGQLGRMNSFGLGSTEIDTGVFFREVDIMLYWAVVFLVIALIAGVLGLFGLAGMAMWIAKVLFFIFLALFVISVVAGGRHRRL
jgi:uncharacterized membrane protein YtjA (UPF0391 family)